MSLSDKTGLRFKRRHLIISVIASFILFLIAGVGLIRKNIADPNIPLLFSEQGAEWIRFREPTIPFVRRPQKRVTIFRSLFRVEKISSKAVLGNRKNTHIPIKKHGTRYFTYRWLNIDKRLRLVIASYR